MPPKVTRNATVSDLINEAQDIAIKAMSGEPVTRISLERLAARVKANILTAVALGRWRTIGVVDPDDFLELGVEAVRGNALKGEPPIKISYDFSKTSKPLIVVDSIARKATP